MSPPASVFPAACRGVQLAAESFNMKPRFRGGSGVSFHFSIFSRFAMVMPVGRGLGVVVGQSAEVGEEKTYLPEPDKKEVGTHGSVRVGRIRTRRPPPPLTARWCASQRDAAARGSNRRRGRQAPLLSTGNIRCFSRIHSEAL